MTPEVTDFISKLNMGWQADICKTLRQLVHETVPGLTERIQYGKPHFLKNGKYAFVLGTAKGWVSFTIFNAEALHPPTDLFESSETGDRKTLKIKEGQMVDYDLLRTLIQQAAG